MGLLLLPPIILRVLCCATPLHQGPDYGSKLGRLGFVAGLIQQQKLDSFERILFRATRGNVFVKSASVGRVRDPSSGEQQEKSAFIIFFAGDRSKTKIMKVWTTITDKMDFCRHHPLASCQSQWIT